MLVWRLLTVACVVPRGTGAFNVLVLDRYYHHTWLINNLRKVADPNQTHSPGYFCLTIRRLRSLAPRHETPYITRTRLQRSANSYIIFTTRSLRLDAKSLIWITYVQKNIVVLLSRTSITSRRTKNNRSDIDLHRVTPSSNIEQFFWHIIYTGSRCWPKVT